MNFENRNRKQKLDLQAQLGNNFSPGEIAHLLKEHEKIIPSRSLTNGVRVQRILKETIQALYDAEKIGIMNESLKSQSMQLLQMAFDPYQKENELSSLGDYSSESHEYDQTPGSLEEIFTRYPLLAPKQEMLDNDLEINTSIRSGVVLKLVLHNRIIVTISLVENEGGDLWEIIHMENKDSKQEKGPSGILLLGEAIKQQIKRPQTIADHLYVSDETIPDSHQKIIPFLNKAGMRNSDQHAGFLLDKHRTRTNINPALLEQYKVD